MNHWSSRINSWMQRNRLARTSAGSRRWAAVLALLTLVLPARAQIPPVERVRVESVLEAFRDVDYADVGYEGASQEEVRREIQRAAEEFAPKLDPLPTGSTWSPLGDADTIPWPLSAAPHPPAVQEGEDRKSVV